MGSRLGSSKEDVPPVQLQLHSGKAMSSEGLKPEPPNCQQCRVRLAAHKVPTQKGGNYRWKCETCFKKLAPSGFKEKVIR